MPLAVDTLERGGVNPSRIILGHISNTAVSDMTLLEDLLKRGVYLQFDVFGNPWQLKMNDKAAADAIVTLAKKGFSRQLLVSHDMCTKFHLTRFGGPAYSTYIA